MFIRKKGKAYCVVESRRVAGRVRQTVLAYLGNQPTIEQAIKHKEEQAQQLRRWLAEDYDARSYRCIFTGSRGTFVERDLESYSIAFSRKYYPISAYGSWFVMQDALAAIKGQKMVYFPADDPRIAYMLHRYQEAKERDFAKKRQKLAAVEKTLSRLKCLRKSV